MCRQLLRPRLRTSTDARPVRLIATPGQPVHGAVTTASSSSRASGPCSCPS
jgi:hypothetical protein